MEKSMHLRLTTQNGTFLEKDVIFIEVCTDSGVLVYIPDQECAVNLIMPGLMTTFDSDGNKFLAALDGGVLIKRNGQVVISAGHVVLGKNREELEKTVSGLSLSPEYIENNLQRSILEMENELFRSFPSPPSHI